MGCAAVVNVKILIGGFLVCHTLKVLSNELCFGLLSSRQL